MIVFASASLLAIREAVSIAVPTESVFNALVNSLIYSSSFRFLLTTLIYRRVVRGVLGSYVLKSLLRNNLRL